MSRLKPDGRSVALTLRPGRVAVGVALSFAGAQRGYVQQVARRCGRGLMMSGANPGWVTNWVTITAHVHGRWRTAAH